jgi:hypothetical protein
MKYQEVGGDRRREREGEGGRGSYFDPKLTPPSFRCVTTEVEGQFQLKGAERRQQANREIIASQGGGAQWLPNQRRDVTHVSRLQCVQAAVANQIENLVANSPETKVALITFSNEVHILGDGDQEEVVVSGDRLSSWEALMEVGRGYRIGKCVKEAKRTLLEKLWALEEGGQTALGPALQLSMCVAANSQGKISLLPPPSPSLHLHLPLPTLPPLPCLLPPSLSFLLVP